MTTINARLRFHLPFATACEYLHDGFSQVALSASSDEARGPTGTTYGSNAWNYYSANARAANSGPV